jgi:ABC-2 type transport system ATP-binding protein
VDEPREAAVLAVLEAHKSYGGRRALDGASLAVRGGEIYALLGPNGAGKTSLVRACYGRVRLDAGRVELFGGDTSTGRARLGLVPQELALYAELSARENLLLFGRLAGLGAAAARAAADTALAWTGLTERANARASTLSGGQQRRLNLAAGTLHGPGLLLLDEPTVGIDPEAREEIHALLRALRARGTAILLTTHDLEQAAELADRIGILVDGRVRAEGTPRSLVEQTFGSASEVLITLPAPADESAHALLAAEGLAAADGGRTFSGPLAGGLDRLAALGRRLAAGSVPVAEIRLRAPGLRGVFLRVAGRELHA